MLILPIVSQISVFLSFFLLVDAAYRFSKAEPSFLVRLESVQPSSKVRLANGLTKQELRQRLMLTFNTPFYPEILVASMIMAEGVDLHFNCRHVIHHDLCWNPSTHEQRTGRIDRIGAKVERCCQPIEVYMPFISKTQDEKMYRVAIGLAIHLDIISNFVTGINSGCNQKENNSGYHHDK